MTAMWWQNLGFAEFMPLWGQTPLFVDWEELSSGGWVIPRPTTPAQPLLTNYFTFILLWGTLHLSKHCQVLPLLSPSAGFWVQTAHRIPQKQLNYYCLECRKFRKRVLQLRKVEPVSLNAKGLMKYSRISLEVRAPLPLFSDNLFLVSQTKSEHPQIIPPAICSFPSGKSDSRGEPCGSTDPAHAFCSTFWHFKLPTGRHYALSITGVVGTHKDTKST